MRMLTDSHPRRQYRTRRQRRCGGSAVIEMALLAPWFLFLFIGVMDVGFFCYDLISVENAARVAAEYTSSGTNQAGDQSGACTRVTQELASLPNLPTASGCNSLPLIVTASSSGANGTGLGSLGISSTVTVTYQTQSLIPIPNLLMQQLTFSRTVVARVKT